MVVDVTNKSDDGGGESDSDYAGIDSVD